MAKDDERSVGKVKSYESIPIGNREVFTTRLEEGFAEVSYGDGGGWANDLRIMEIWAFFKPVDEGEQLDITTYELQKFRDGLHTSSSRYFECLHKPAEFAELMKNHGITLGRRVILTSILGIRKEVHKIYQSD